MERILPFPVEELKARLARTEAALSQQGLDAALITGPENVCYLTGNPVSGPMALLVRPGDPPLLLADEYDEYNIRTYSWIEEARFHDVGESWIDLAADELTKSSGRVRTLGVDTKSSSLSVSVYDRLRARLPHWVTVEPFGAVEECRLLKSAREVEYIRRAAHVASVSMRAGLAAIGPGRRENDIAGEIYRAGIEAGGEHLASQPYVKAGRRAWVTHGRWDGTEIHRGDLVFIELAGCIKRYHAAIMRTAVCGEPDRKLQRVADAVLRSADRTLDRLRPGVPACEVDRAYREVITAAGFGRYNRHALGYSIGVAFAPGWGEPEIFMISPVERRTIQAGMTFHLVPSVTIPGEVGHVACSATVLIREDGPEVLTDVARQVVALPA
jgi:Xaa-Pro dipeptidase